MLSLDDLVVYFDDILIYSKSLEEHLEHLCVVFISLRDERLFRNLEKCTFCTNWVSFLGYFVTPQGIEVDRAKIEAIESWSQPKTVTQVRNFLGLAGFYRRFVEILAPLLHLSMSLQRRMCLLFGVPPPNDVIPLSMTSNVHSQETMTICWSQRAGQLEAYQGHSVV